MEKQTQYYVGLYCRLSKDDDLKGESMSIGTQRSILSEYCSDHQYQIIKVYIDDGYSGMNFNRPGFLELLEDVDKGLINMVITKDLSRLGRDYIMTGYYSEIFFPSKGVRYIAIADDFDSASNSNEIAPFRNILNDMYARDISRKVKNAKRQRAKNGTLAFSQAPYGYQKDKDMPSHLIVDSKVAETVRMIFDFATQGSGAVAIARELESREILTPSAYKNRIQSKHPFHWSHETVRSILRNRVYIGDLELLKTEVTNCKTKQRIAVPETERIRISNAHEAIIPKEQFEKVQAMRAQHRCPAQAKRENIFRGLLFCDCCGHPLTISKKKLKDREADIYLCMHHYRHPKECPETHRIYHEMLYSFVLEQVRAFAKVMKRRKVNTTFKDYASIDKLTPEILREVVERIEIGHVKYNTKPRKVIHIYWKIK